MAAARQRLAARAGAAGARLAAALMLLTDARRLHGAAATNAAGARWLEGRLELHCMGTATRETAATLAILQIVIDFSNVPQMQ